MKRLNKNMIAKPKKISTGEPSTLGTYRNIAKCFVGMDESRKVIKFFDDKIANSPNGENEIVLADETQMLQLINQLVKEDSKGDNN